MVLPLSGYSDRELLRVKLGEIEVLIKGKPIHPTVEQLRLHRDDRAEWQQSNLEIVTFGQPFEASCFDPFKGNEQTGMTSYQPGVPVFPCFYEQRTYNIQIKIPNGQNLQFYHENKYLRDSVSCFSGVLSGNLNFKNDIGFSDLQIHSSGRCILKIRLEVFPAKLDYRRDFQALLQEVTDEVYNLAYDYLQRTYFAAKLTPSKNSSLTEFFSIIKLIYAQLLKALDLVQTNPHHRIVQVSRVDPLHKVRRFDHHNTKWLTRHPEVMRRKQDGTGILVKDNHYLPERLQDNKKTITYDTFENRFIRWVLKKIVELLGSFRQQYRLTYGESSRFDLQVDEGIREMMARVQVFQRKEFLSQVGEITQLNNISLVLQMAPGYREVYRYYLMLIKGLSIQSDIFHLSYKDLATLYEYWCFLSLHKLLRRKYQLKKNSLIKVNSRGLSVSLRKDRGADMTYVNPINGEVFNLAYQERANNAPSVAQVPDNVLSLVKEGSNVNYKYVFDAKYRVNSALDPRYRQIYKKPGPEEDDINTMHRYRDAMVYHNKEKGFQRSVFGAYVLFPYADEADYSGQKDGNPHRFYESIGQINLGGLPFLPGHTKLVEQALDELILSSPETALEKAILHDGTEYYYYNKFHNKNVYVGSLRNARQWDINYNQCFYHTPLKNVGKVLGALEYIAVYFSNAAIGQQKGVRYYGKVSDYKILPRDQITQIPKAGKESYVLFTIEEWIELPQPIQPMGYGVYQGMLTTLPLLLSARELPELRLANELEVRLWKELRRLVPEASLRLSNKWLDQAEVAEMSSPFGSIRLEDNQLVLQNNRGVKTWDINDLRRNRLKVFREIRASLHDGVY